MKNHSYDYYHQNLCCYDNLATIMMHCRVNIIVNISVNITARKKMKPRKNKAMLEQPLQDLLENRSTFSMKIKHSAFLFKIVFLKKELHNFTSLLKRISNSK